MNQPKKKQRGITLIALIVTIIVLLILAGVTLKIVAGEQGILKRTEKAVIQNSKGSAIEDLELAVADLKIKYWDEGANGSPQDYVINGLNKYQEIGGNLSGQITVESNGELTYISNDTTITGKIDENGNLQIDQAGLILTSKSVTLEIEDETNLPTVDISATRIEISDEITWSSSDSAIATVTGNGTDATITAVAQGTTTITASCAGYVATCTVTVTQPMNLESIIGEFVHYEVPYTDIYYDTYNYTANNGWRIINIKENTETAETYDVEIISTGIPAGLVYRSNDALKTDLVYDGTDGKWTGNDEQRANYVSEFYAYNNDASNYNIYAAAGLYNNFEKILFKGTDSVTAGINSGYFKKIKEQTPTETTTGNIFRSSGGIESKITKIRSVMLYDLTGNKGPEMEWTEKATGLLTLKNLPNIANAEVHGVASYNYNSINYWLASPKMDIYDLRWLNDEGIIFDGSGLSRTFNGLRPVISLSGVTIRQDSASGIWYME